MPSPFRLVLALFAALSASLSGPLHAQTTLSGSFQADPAIPTLISPAQQGSNYFVLNQDLSITGRFYPPNGVCPPPAGLSASSKTPRTLTNDNQDAYFTAQSTGANVAASTTQPGSTCLSAPILPIDGGTPTQTLTANDTGLNYFYVLNAFAGNGPDTFTALNPSATSSGLSLTKNSATNLDTNGVYTSVVPDTNAFGLVAITSIKTATSPGNLFVYSPGIGVAFKILGPGGAPLPAVTSFIIPNSANDDGNLLILVNQDNRTASNSQSPSAVASPITIIDLGQLRRAMAAVVPQGTTIQLDNIKQIRPTAPYYGVLGAVYSPVFHSVYVLASIANGSGGFTQNVIRYDLQDPSAPNETIVADVSTISIPFGTTPQLTLDSTEGTLFLLNPTDKTLYRVVVAGKNNTPAVVTGAPFPDSNFKPTYIASNTLLGETYIASSTQVDILNRSATSVPRATVELYGLDYAIVGQTYDLRLATQSAQYDPALDAAPVTVTATPKGGGTPFTLYSGTVHDFYPGYNGPKSVTFTAPGVYTLVASVPAAGAYPAFSSLPAQVSVGASAIAPIYPTTLILSLPATSSSTSVTASLTLRGSTYAPSGTILISDAAGKQVGRYDFTQGATSYPISVPLTLPNGTSTLTATYDGKGDTQNQPSTSAPASITVSPVAQVTPTLTLGLPASAAPGSTVTGTITFGSSTTSAPTGNIEIDVVPSGSTTPTVILVPAAQAFVAGGKSFTFTAPTAPGGATVFASYKGDSSYNLAYSSSSTLNITGSSVSTSTSLSAVATATAGTPFTVTVRFSQATSNSTAPTGFITVQATNAAGSVTILGTVTIAQATASGGYALQATLTNPGAYTITATYNGDSLYSPSSGSIGVNVTAVKGTLALNPYIPTNTISGSAITGTLGISASGNASTPTGNVLLTITSVTTGVSTVLCTVPASTSGTTNCPFTAPAADHYRYTASYAGDSNFNAASSTPTDIFVTAAIGTTNNISAPATVTVGTPFIVTVALAQKTAANPAPSGNVTLIATPASGPAITLATIPTSQALVSGGTQINVTLNTAGSYTITSSYPGDFLYAPSTGTLGIRIAQATTVLSLTSTITSAQVGAPFGVHVGINGFYSPSGNINVSAQLNGSTVPPVTSSTSVAGATIGGGSLVSLTLPTAGIYTITAAYSGDANNAASTAGPLSVTAAVSASNLILSGPSTVPVSTAASFAVKLNSFTTLSSSSNVLVTSTLNGAPGPSATVLYSDATDGTNVQLVFPTAGTYTVAASFAGDASNPAATATPVSIIVTPITRPSFTFYHQVKADGSDITLTNLSSTDTNTLTFTAFGGFNTPLNLSVTPAYATNIKYTFKDADGKVITSFIPSTTGTPITLVASGVATAELTPLPVHMTRLPVYFGSGLLLLSFIRARRRNLGFARALKLLTVLLVVGFSGTLLGGCMGWCAPSNQENTTVVISATPANSTLGVAAQSQTLTVSYDPGLDIKK